MDENKQSVDVLRQSFDLSIRQMTTLLEAQAELRRVAEKRMVETWTELERATEALCPGLIDELRKASPDGISRIPPRDLVDAMIHSVRQRLSKLDIAEVSGKSIREMYDKTMTENTRLRKEVDRLGQELTKLQQKYNRDATRLTVLQQMLGDAQRRLETPEDADHQVPVSEPRSAQSSSPAPEPDPVPQPLPEQPEPTTPTPPVTISNDRLPEWMREWQRTKSFERDLELLDVLAKTGAPRRSEVAAVLAARTKVQSGGGGITRLFNRCARIGLIDLVKAKSETIGSSVHHLVGLTEQGRDACRLLLDIEPAKNQMVELLKRHKNPEHALLNLEAADLLREAGYTVDLFPGRVDLPEGRLFLPDLVASRHGKVLFVEAERDTTKTTTERNQKWQNYFDATGGEFYIVTANKKTLEKIRGEVLFWKTRQKQLSLWMTNVSDAKGKKGDWVWLSKRGKPR